MEGWRDGGGGLSYGFNHSYFYSEEGQRIKK